MPIGPAVTTTRTTRHDHTDFADEFLQYTNGTTGYTVFQNVLVSRDKTKTVIVSRSTRPWTAKKPTLWTPYKKEVWTLNSDAATGFCRWTPGSLWTAVRYRDRRRNGGFGHVFNFDPTWRLPYPSIDRNVLDNKLLNKLKDDFNGAVFAAEMKRSLGMIGDRLVKLGKAARACRSLRFGDAAKALDFPPKRKLSRNQRRLLSDVKQSPLERDAMKGWLELQYGWMPLMKDIQSAVELVKRADPSYFVEAVVSNRFKGKSRSSTWSNSKLDGMLQQIEQSTEWYMSGKLKFEWKPDNVYLRRISEISLLNPALVAWELVPFSFVVDWFLPIGDFLNALDATFGVQFVGGLYVETVKLRSSHEGFAMRADPVRDSAEGHGLLDESYARKERFVLTGFPSVKLPSFKNPVSTGHCANALALLTTSFRGRGK